ncbi:MAG: EamA family transporter [Flavobacteriales bacterium]|nr:EamA family transporter [Flavobacteriales bacterium]
MSTKLKAHIALLSATIFYGLNFIIAKDVMPNYVGAFGFIVIRVIGAGALFWILGSFIKEKVDKKDFPRLAFSALFGVGINMMMFFKGLSLTTPINASIIVVSNPIIVLIIASVMLKEKITTRKLIGIFIGAVGAITLIAYGKEVNLTGENVKLGNLLILINATSYAFFLVVVKPLMQKYHPITVSKWVFFFGFFFITPFGYTEFMEISWSTMPIDMLLRVAYVVLFTSFFAYLLNIYALKEIKASTVSFYVYLQPIIATIASIYLGKETLMLHETLAAATIFYGVYLVNTKGRKEVRS